MTDRLLVLSDEYEIVIDAVAEARSVFRRLAGEGGFAITHVGCARRVDAKLMEIEEARQLAETLTWWLSLLRGERTAPILLRGMQDRAVQWELWQPRTVQSWTGPKSWLPANLDDTTVTNSLGVIFQSLHNLDASDDRESVHRLIDLYNQSQHNEHTGAILVMAQAGLELASWLDCHGDVLPGDGHNAAGRLRCALKDAKISPVIPETLEVLRSEPTKGDSGQIDGPEAITGFRNSVIHPELDERFSSPTSQLQCLQLSIRYLELLILHRLGYLGRMKDRTDVVFTDAFFAEADVPWAS
ncbi:MAG: hypothetical protein WA359_02195 [Acidimicrobiales bacterium]